MGLSDDMPQENSTRPPRTRLDQLVAFFSRNDGEFFKGKDDKKGLLDTNPVFVYPFGGRLDDEAKEFKKGGGADRGGMERLRSARPATVDPGRPQPGGPRNRSKKARVLQTDQPAMSPCGPRIGSRKAAASTS